MARVTCRLLDRDEVQSVRTFDEDLARRLGAEAG